MKRKLAKEGKALNHKRIWRLWREAGLCVPPRRRKKKLRTGKPATALVAEQPDAVWCLDFLEDKSLGGQKGSSALLILLANSKSALQPAW